MTLTVGSLFAGVGGFDLGFRAAGFTTRWMCEINRECGNVLRRQFPEIETLYTNIETMDGAAVEPVDVLCGGFPCQDLSVAGKRAGLDGARSGLFFQFARVIREIREATDGRYPTFVVLENVPGLLSSNGGRDFAVVLRELGQCGAVDVAWRVLDAQWFGVPQRRRRVFIVCDFGGERAAEILALSQSVRGDSPPRRTAGEGVAATVSGRAMHDRGDGSGNLIGFQWKGNYAAEGFGIAPTLTVAKDAGSGGAAVAYACQGTNVGEMGALRSGNGNVTGEVPFVLNNRWGDAAKQTETLRANSHGSLPILHSHGSVRRLTPTETERLMGWPDGHTRWGADGREMPDSVRYRMCGNGVVASVAEWMGRNIAGVLA